MSNIKEYFDPANLPDYMGGECIENYRFVPKGVFTLDEMVSFQRLSIKNDKDLKRLNEHFQKLIKLE